MELDNGCVCCGPGAGELAPAVASLRDRRVNNKPAFDHVVVELSGVADPTNVQANLKAGGVGVDRRVALVDANSFPALYNSQAAMVDRLDLAGATELWADPCAVDRAVVDLLLLQVETADVVLVNKADLATAEELRTTLAACRALNAKATIVTTEFGDAQPAQLLPSQAAHEHGHADGCADPKCADAGHDHGHAHSHDAAAAACSDPACTDASHDHDHSHGGGDACSDPLCTDPTHAHDARVCVACQMLRGYIPRPITTSLACVRRPSPIASVTIRAVDRSDVDTLANRELHPFNIAIRNRGAERFGGGRATLQ